MTRTPGAAKAKPSKRPDRYVVGWHQRDTIVYLRPYSSGSDAVEYPMTFREARRLAADEKWDGDNPVIYELVRVKPTRAAGRKAR